MSAQHLEVLETTVQKTHEWLDAIAEEGHFDTHTAYQALRGVLQTLRDRLPAEEAAHLGAQLPMLVRGIFYEGWRPSDVPVLMTREQFLKRVDEKLVSARAIDALSATRAVFRVMNNFLSEGEIPKIELVLPAEYRSLFPGGPELVLQK